MKVEVHKISHSSIITQREKRKGSRLDRRRVKTSKGGNLKWLNNSLSRLIASSWSVVVLVKTNKHLSRWSIKNCITRNRLQQLETKTTCKEERPHLRGGLRANKKFLTMKILLTARSLNSWWAASMISYRTLEAVPMNIAIKSNSLFIIWPF
jgi:hypothetical protein